MVRLFRHYVPRFILVMGALEGAVIFGAFYLGVAYQLSVERTFGSVVNSHSWQQAGFCTLILIAMFASMGLYERGLRDQLSGIWLRVALGFSGGLLLMLGLMAIQPGMIISDNAIFAALAISASGVLLIRTVFYQFAESSKFKQRIMVFGASGLAEELERLRRRSDWQDNLLVGYLPLLDEKPQVRPSKVLLAKGTLLETANHYNIDEIVVAIREVGESFPVAELWDCKMSGIEVEDISIFLERMTGKMKLEALSPGTMIFADGFVQALHKGMVHRGFDVLVSVVFLLLSLPVMLMTAAAIFIESGARGPVLYKQFRIGRQGRRFEILKFRSMQVDAEKDGTAVWATHNDARVTRVGAFIRKTRIDELPQLWNVLKNEMSFVGPRPERPEFVEQLSEKIPYYDLRHTVNPGLTGWAQIRYPYGSSEEDAKEKLQYDLYYVKNYSLFLDLTILLQTAQVVLWGKGAR